MYKTITLSDGESCRVRQLGLYELNGKGFRELIGPYRYSLLLATGQIVEDEYDIRALDFTPTAPAEMPVEQGSEEWYQLKEYETYLAALAHERTRVESYHNYVEDVVEYILEKCLENDDRNRVVTLDDWDKVYQAALVPELTLEVISATLRNTFQGFLWWAGDTQRNFRHLRR